MLIIETPLILYQIVKQWRQKQNYIALIPTMGNLHEGHMTLINAGRSRADKVVVSVFVNPIQFDRPEDLVAYLRTLQEDCEQLLRRGVVDIVFAPESAVIYPCDFARQTVINVPNLAHILEGERRLGHFRGVATIISKLFNLVQPDVACLGEKDFQQLALIRQLVQDINYHVKIISIPTVRAADGLALSSRNSYLNADERRLAPQLNQVLTRLVVQLRIGDRHAGGLLASAAEQLVQAGMKPDMLVIRDAETLQPLIVESQRAVVLFTAWLGKARLIDNAQVDSLIF